ncbi:MAG: zinc ribbon domain-containing protein [Clostridia bacterium]|nr:zinc ribbon domain-containing protein [Clostridia bacterium]
MDEILKMLNALTADELDSVILRAGIMLEKKRKDEAEQARLEQERLRQEKIEQEKRRQQEIAELQRKLQELQGQRVDIPDVAGDGFVMRGSSQPQTDGMIACPQCKAMCPAESQFCPSCGQRLAAPAQPKMSDMVACPHCHMMNVAGVLFCANCGQRIKAQPAPQPTPQPRPAPQPQPTAQAPANAAQVFHAGESMKKWEMLPGEQTVKGRHEIILLQPQDGKFVHHMEVTNQRILLYRESNASRNAGMAARMGGGLLGSMIAEGVKAAAGAGPKPWLAIPLAAVSNCGLQGKKEFFIVADQTYVLKNHRYESLLPDLVAKAKR